MTKVHTWRMCCATFVLCAATAIAAPAQIFTTLVNFNGIDGDEPNPPYLVQGTNGGLYGTTESGGMIGSGTIFKLRREGGLKMLYSFTCDQNSCAGDVTTGVLLGTNGLLYGTTWSGGGTACQGGCGTVFEMTQSGLLTTLHDFNLTDGSYPPSGVIEGVDGNFYGTTTYGGSNDIGTVFKITPRGALTTLHSFSGADGASPSAGLIQASDGNFYGTTVFGGASECSNGCGTVFKITPDGRLTTLYEFCARPNCADGAEPMSSLFQGIDGDFYGTTYYGGNTTCVEGCGTIFRITPGGALTTLYSFCSLPSCADGIWPRAGVQIATDGNLYGTTSLGGAMYGLGVAFSLSSNGTFSLLHTFDPTNGGEPSTGLLQDTDGSFYGANYYGGTYNSGTLFSLDVGLGPFVSFLRAAGKAGESGPILGQGLTGTTAVELNGTPANFTVVSDTFIKATVPAGATTGYVTVTTPTGVLTSNVPFRVIH